MTVSVVNLTRRNPVPVSLLQSTAKFASARVTLGMDVCIVLVGEKRMASLNQKFLGHPGPTDVITFEHGEIVICPAVALRQAKSHGSTLKQEMLRYVIHGVLHLKGYNDVTGSEYRRMKVKEEEILKKL